MPHVNVLLSPSFECVLVKVIDGVPSCVGVPGVGVEGPVGVWEREEALERGGRVIARRKRSFSGMFAVLYS